MGHRALFLFFVGIITGSTACQDSTVAAVSDEADLVAKVLANNADVRDDRLIFPQVLVDAKLRSRIDHFRAELAAGKRPEDIENVILLGDRQADAADASGKLNENVPNPYGFIRRALSYHDEGGKTVIMTEHASLEEAFAELSEGRTIEVGAQPRSADLSPQVRKTFTKTIPLLEFGEQNLLQDDRVTVKLRSGSVDLDAAIDLAADISAFKLQHAHVIVDARIGSELVLEASSREAFTVSPKTDVFAAHWPIGMLGPIPVTLALKATIGCDVQAAAHVVATAGLSASASVRGGVSYDRGKSVEPIFEHPSFTPTVISPKVDAGANASTKCYLRPQISVLFYDVAGPFVTPGVYGKLEASVAPFQARAAVGFTTNVGGKLSIFGKDLASIDKEVFAVERELWRSN
ncbi:MAG TPA: hypothetical protein VM925_06350 [Labilithrix sp.]|nr:hypothetical protein [Labilithrix sp.]